MDVKEALQLIYVMVQSYPNLKMSDKEIKDMAKTWQFMLSEFTYNEVALALKSYITSSTSGFAPSIGEIVDVIHKMKAPECKNEMEAWALVSKALRNGAYGAQEEFNKLPPLVQKAVGSCENIRAWSMAAPETIESVIQSNFIKTYRNMVNKSNSISKMPTEARLMIESINYQEETKRLCTDEYESEKGISDEWYIPEDLEERIRRLGE